MRSTKIMGMALVAALAMSAIATSSASAGWELRTGESDGEAPVTVGTPFELYESYNFNLTDNTGVYYECDGGYSKLAGQVTAVGSTIDGIEFTSGGVFASCPVTLSGFPFHLTLKKSGKADFTGIMTLSASDGCSYSASMVKATERTAPVDGEEQLRAIDLVAKFKPQIKSGECKRTLGLSSPLLEAPGYLEMYPFTREGNGFYIRG